MLPWEGPACCCLSVYALVCCNEYQGVSGNSGAVSTSGNSLCCHGNGGGTMGICGIDTGHACVDWPGLGGLVGGWASLTRSSPSESDSMSDKEIIQLLSGTGVDRVNWVSFAGNHVSSNFTSWEISKH